MNLKAILNNLVREPDVVCRLIIMDTTGHTETLVKENETCMALELFKGAIKDGRIPLIQEEGELVQLTEIDPANLPEVVIFLPQLGGG